MLKCVCYDFVGDILYLALKSGEILLFNAKTSPCTPTELWMPLNAKQEVTCATIVSHETINHTYSYDKCTENRLKQ